MTLIAGLLNGCGGGTIQRFNITIEPDDGLRDQTTYRMPSIEMDLVGVGAGDAVVKNIPVDHYFNPRPPERPDVRTDLGNQKVTYKFSNENHEPQTLPIDHAAWAYWEENNYAELMVIVNYLPGAAGDDARRLLIPLNPERWSRPGSTMTITIQRSRLQFSPKPDAE